MNVFCWFKRQSSQPF